MKLKKSGFTLVEIMIVVAIIGLLAAIAIPSFVKARNTARLNACVNNLRMIDAGKEQWAMAANLGDGVDCVDSNVYEYIKGNARPICPAGGAYTFNDVGTPADCNYTGH